MTIASVPWLLDRSTSSRSGEISCRLNSIQTCFDGASPSASRRRRRRGVTVFVLSLAAASVLVTCAVSTRAQQTPGSAAGSDTLRNEIKVATEQNSSAAQLGMLWLKLANEYQSRLELSQAEDAFTHSLSLLRFPATRSAYADALEGLGSLYFAKDHMAEAENCIRKALDIYKELDDQTRAASLHVTLALILVSEHRFRDAEVESSKGLKEFESRSHPDSNVLVSALLTHSYALCNQGRCNAALDDARRAMALAQRDLAANSIDTAGVWLACGFDSWKAGWQDEADQAMRKALAIVSSRTDLPRPMQVGLQLGVLRQYQVFLRSIHRNSEAKQTETEILQLQSEQHPSCDNCTINASALSPEPLRR